jgi:hypothetical protein
MINNENDNIYDPRFVGNREGAAPSSGGFQPGRPMTTKKEPLKFDNEYDFEQANEEFKEFLSKFEVSTETTFIAFHVAGPRVSSRGLKC